MLHAYPKRCPAPSHGGSALPPVMLHHVPRAMAPQLSRPGLPKLALLVLDGLALDQWIVLREVLLQQRPGWRFVEEAVFGWVPTITCVSRQALFAGKALFFPGSIHTTDKEAAMWTQFWVDHGLSAGEVGYVRGLAEMTDLAEVDGLLSRPAVRVAGLVVDKIDRIMHGMELGTAGMHNQVRQWAEQGILTPLLDMLLERSFDVWLTSDHGNIEAMGIGRPSEGGPG